MIAEETLELLRKRAHARGYITPEDLRDVMPVEDMSADELARVVLQLEEAGVSVEIEDALNTAARRREATISETPTIDLPAGQPTGRDARQPAQAPGVSADAFTAAEPVASPAPAAGGWMFVAAAGAVILLGAIALFAFLR